MGHEKLRSINDLFLASVFHPYVRPKRPPPRPALPSPTRSGERAVKDGRRPPRQRREASLRGRSLLRDPWRRRGSAFGCGSVPHFRFPSPLQLAGSKRGSASNSSLAVPSKSALLLTQ